jgi:hypothetical protein
LRAEIIRRHPEQDEPTIAIALPELLEPSILRRVAAFRCGVHDQHRLATPGRKQQLAAIDLAERKIKGVHADTGAKRFASAAA